MVLTSDGITEAHDPDGEMYGFPRLMSRVARKPSNGDMVAAVVRDLEEFTGADVEQEDDITLVVVRRTSSAQDSAQTFEDAGRVLDSFTVASEEGNERIAIDRVSAVIVPLGLDSSRLERLKTAVGETVMNAMEHGNDNRPELDVAVEVSATEESIRVRVTDQGGGRPIPEATTPDLEAKLAGEQTPRGWGLFLVEQMVDDVRSTSEGGAHTIELIMNREGAA
jgi:anti-sigma regulatory factor (Ser/Thr protein kinase)